MTTEINVISRTQIILVDPTSGSVSVINAGPPGPAGPAGGGGGLVLPPGLIMPFPASVIPTGWLICDGAVYNNTQYPALAAVLSNLYGGNGTSTFAVPNCRGKAIFGRNPAAVPFNVLGASGGALNHNHGLDNNGYAKLSIAALNAVDTMKTASVNTPNWPATFGNKTVLGWGGPASANANRGTALGGRTADAVNEVPPFIVMNYIIKT